MASAFAKVKLYDLPIPVNSVLGINVVTWNLNALPSAILIYAVPLSLLETFIASYICKKMSPGQRTES